MKVFASNKSDRISCTKVRPIANMLKGLSVESALKQLDFSARRKPSLMIKKIIFAALSNAHANFGLDVDNLFVDSVIVEEASTIKRSIPRARGRSNRIMKRCSKIKVVLREF